ncbi:MAG: endonuclease/exonuclease/phosphatase family protein [Bacteroidaceae bacterium]|nr:endonuclease/exonuclease/phosphatase family protein [Bacteroidaceae bacterium]
MCRKAFTLLFLMLLTCSESRAQRIVFWNLENLFDCRHDSLKNDYDFLPEGSYHWTKGRYWRKLDNLSRTFAAIADEGAWPMAIGVCEVENDSCLFDLTRRSPLRMARYAFIHEEGPDVRGIDVAMLYDSTQFQLLGHEAVRIPSAELGYRPTRDILHAWGQCPSVPDTLHLVVVHLPSRAGSGREGTEHRRLAVKTLCNLLDELDGKSVLLMGDFNSEPTDRIFREIGSRLTSLMPQSRKELRQAQGTYYFRNVWSFLDHILVSPRLLPRIGKSINVGRFPFLLTEKGTPWRTFQGPVYKGGISDHLPIWVDLLSR